MNQLLVADHATYAAKQGGGVIAGIAEAHLLVDGAMALFTETGVLVTAATVPSTIANVKQFTIAVNSTNNGLFQSTPIDRDAFFRGYCAYVAPVKQVRAVGFNGATGSMNYPTLVVGDEAELAVGIYDPTLSPGMRWHRVNYTVRNGDTAAIITAALITAINAHPTFPATAVALGANLGIQLTADNFEEVLEIRLDGIIADATITTNTALVYGKGTPTQVREAEKASWLEDGDDNRVHFASQYWDIASDVDVSQYDLFSLQWATERANAIGVDIVAAPRITLAIGDTTLRASINTILTTVLLISIPGTGSGSSNSGI